MMWTIGNNAHLARPSLAMALFEMSVWPRIKKKFGVDGRKEFNKHFDEWVKELNS